MRSLAVLANGNVGVAREVHRAGDVRRILLARRACRPGSRPQVDDCPRWREGIALLSVPHVWQRCRRNW